MNILDLDHSLTAQAPIRSLLDSGRATLLDLLDLGPKLRLWTTERQYRRFERQYRRFTERLRQLIAPAAGRPQIIFVGSGDYHHLTPAFLGNLPEPISLIHFDNHPDWAAR